MANAVSPGSRFRYRCLGPAELRGPAGRALPLRTRKHRALLYMLARKAGAPTSRDVLVELLWPDAGGPRAAKHSLTQSASLINKALGTEVIVAAGKDLITMREGVLTVDALDFEDHAANGRAEEAFALWGGDLLEGLWVRGAPTFERYLADERERLRRVLRGVLKELIESRQRAGNWAGMRAASEKLLEVDPLDEAAMLRYLEALILLDDRTLALRRYGEFEKRLKEELEAEPGEGLRRWVKRQRTGEALSLRSNQQRVGERSTFPTTRPVFGREGEFSALWRSWESAKGGRGSLTVLEGLAGIGKTALALKVANQARANGGAVCFMKCHRSERAVPFAPVTELIRQLSRLPGFIGTGPLWIGELTRLAPDLRDRFPGSPPPMAIDDSARHRLCDATFEAIRSVANEQPLLIVVDDIHEADEATLALLHFVGRQVAGIPVVQLCTARSNTSNPDTARFLESCQALQIAAFAELGQLPDVYIAVIAKQVFAECGKSAEDVAVRRIQQIAGGNPLVAIEAALQAARLPPAGQAHTLPLEPPDPRETPQDDARPFLVSSLQRLSALPESARLVASVIAVSGREVADHLIAAITDLSVADLSAALDALDEAGFVQRVGRGIALTHESYSRTIENVMSTETRRTLHERLADRLSRSAAEDPSACFEVATHLAAAGIRDGARTQALQAAEYAASLGATRERATALALALDLDDALDPFVAVELCSCYVSLGEFDQFGRLKAALNATQAPQAFACDLEFLELQAAHLAGTKRLDEIAGALHELIGRGVPFAREYDARWLLLRATNQASQHAASRRAARDLRRAAQGSSGRWQAYAALATSFIRSKYLWPAAALPYSERGLRIAQTARDWRTEYLARVGLGAVLRQLARYGESLAHLQAAHALARRTLSREFEAQCLGDMAVAEFASGNYARAGELYDQVDRLGLAGTPLQSRIQNASNRGELYLLLGRVNDARTWFETSSALAEQNSCIRWGVTSIAGQVLCAQRQGDQDRVQSKAVLVRHMIGSQLRATHDRWLVEAALAWDAYYRLGDLPSVMRDLDHAVRELRRRDIDHSLHLELEVIRLVEAATGTVDVGRRNQLARLSEHCGAKGILRALSVRDRS